MTIATTERVLLGDRASLEFDAGTGIVSIKVDGTTILTGSVTGGGASDAFMTLASAQNVAGLKTFQALNRESVENAVVAHSGGTQALAYALTKRFSALGTVAAAGDSVSLVAAVAGAWQIVFNGGANVAQVFGAGTDTITSIATATGVPLAVGKWAFFFCTAAGNWLCGDLKPSLPRELYATDASTTNVSIAQAKVAGADDVVLDMTGALGSGQNITMPTAAQIVAAIPNAFVGQTYKLRIRNASSGAFAWTVVTNTGLTLTGTMTIAQNTYREFIVTLTSLSAVVLQSLGQVIIAT